MSLNFSQAQPAGRQLCSLSTLQGQAYLWCQQGFRIFTWFHRFNLCNAYFPSLMSLILCDASSTFLLGLSSLSQVLLSVFVHLEISGCLCWISSPCHDSLSSTRRRAPLRYSEGATASSSLKLDYQSVCRELALLLSSPSLIQHAPLLLGAAVQASSSPTAIHQAAWLELIP